jgi:hypothetical protein
MQVLLLALCLQPQNTSSLTGLYCTTTTGVPFRLGLRFTST